LQFCYTHRFATDVQHPVAVGANGDDVIFFRDLILASTPDGMNMVSLDKLSAVSFHKTKSADTAPQFRIVLKPSLLDLQRKV